MIILLVLTNLFLARAGSMEAIYGEDNRLDVYDSKNTLLKNISASTAAMIPKEHITFKNKFIQIKAPLFKNLYNLCSEERFRGQLTAATCSGTLIHDDIILTAGHCFSNTTLDCTNNFWVFNYFATSQIQSSIHLSIDNLYRCSKILEIKNDFLKNIDFALIKLDRKVTGRSPIQMRLSGTISTRDPLALIGHPRGLPTKIADGGYVLKIEENFFTTNLDAFSTNSGSGVFNSKTGKLEGVLISGASDFETDPKRNCTLSKRYQEDEGEEVVTKVESIIESILNHI